MLYFGEIKFYIIGVNETLSKIGFTNTKIETLVEQNLPKNTKYHHIVSKVKGLEMEREKATEKFQNKQSIPDLNAYENLPAVRVNSLTKNKPNEVENLNYEESQLYSILNNKNIDFNDSRSGLPYQGQYKHYTGNEFILEERATRNIPNSVKMGQELCIDGTTDFLNKMDPSMRPLLLKPKMKANRLRKKSKLKEAKLPKEKETPLTSQPPKSKGYNLKAESTASTPLNLHQKGKCASEDKTTPNVNNGKHSANSFVFMKNSVAAMRKANSFPAQDPVDIEDNKTETVKNSGTIILNIYENLSESISKFLCCFLYDCLIFLIDKSQNSTAPTTATEQSNVGKSGNKLKNVEVTPKMRQNIQKMKSKRDMSANPSAQRNKFTNELLRLEKSGALNNLPKISVETPLIARRIKFNQCYIDYDRIWYKRGDCKEEYIRKDQLKQNNKFIKSCKIVYDMNEKSPYYTDPKKPYLDEKRLIPLKDNGQFVPHRRFKAAGFRKGMINTGIPIKDKYYLDLNPYYVTEDGNDTTLVFESRFESGNLKKAILITDNEYDLYLRSDYSSQGYGQWFYFKVTNMRVNSTYTFNIVNHFKPDSLHNQGMKPLMYSAKKAKLEGCGWHRAGKNICYYPTGTKKKSGGGYYY